MEKLCLEGKRGLPERKKKTKLIVITALASGKSDGQENKEQTKARIAAVLASGKKDGAEIKRETKTKISTDFGRLGKAANRRQKRRQKTYIYIAPGENTDQIAKRRLRLKLLNSLCV